MGLRAEAGVDLVMDTLARIEYGIAARSTSGGIEVHKDNRHFVEAVLWIMCAGSPWRDLPMKLRYWLRTFVRFSCWREKGVWKRVATALRRKAEMDIRSSTRRS